MKTLIRPQGSFDYRLPCLIALAAGVVSATADGLDHWHWRNPLPSANSMQSIAFGNGVFVAVGQGGTMQSSADGQCWNFMARLVTSTLNKVIYAAGQFVAVGNQGVILTSTDGNVWTTRSSGATNHLWAVAYGSSTCAAVGTGGAVVTSKNGIQWTFGSAGTAIDLGWVVFGNGLFVVSAPTVQYAPAAVLTSPDAVSWSRQSISPGQQSGLAQLAFGNGKFLAYLNVYDPRYPVWVPYFYTSTDGTNWTKGPDVCSIWPDPWLSCPRSQNLVPGFLWFSNGHFIEVGNLNIGNITGLSLSVDGQTWSGAPLAKIYPVKDLAYGSGKYVMVGWVACS